MSLFPSSSAREAVSHSRRKMCGETLRGSMTLVFLFDLQCRSNGLEATTVDIDSKFHEVAITFLACVRLIKESRRSCLAFRYIK